MLKNVYYINLEERKDRKELVENELNELGWEYERFNAIKTTNGRVGCSMSHLKLIQMAKEKDLDYIVIVEDDIQFMRKSWYNEKIKNILDNNFDVFLLAGNLRPPIYKINEDVCKITKSFWISDKDLTNSLSSSSIYLAILFEVTSNFFK